MNDKPIDLRIKRFQQALHASKGATNNSLTFDMVKYTDASTEELVRLGGQKGNEGYYNSYSFPGHETHHFNRDAKRLKEVLKELKTKPLTLSDYSWYFDKNFLCYVPNKIAVATRWDGTGNRIVYYDVVKDTFNDITNKDYKSLDSNALKVMTLKHTLDTISSDALPKQALKRMMDDEEYFKKNVLGLRDVDFKYDETGIGIETTFRLPSLYRAGETGKHIVDTYLKMCAELHLLEHLMINECYDDIKKDDDYLTHKGHARELTNVFMGRIYNWGMNDRVSKETAKLFKIVRTYGILLEMGIGMYSYKRRTATQSHFGRVSTRVRTIYKKFMNAKTVDERKSLRELLLSQLKVIAVDFYGHEYDFSIMPCAQEQDAEFEKSHTKVKTKKADNGSKPAKAQKGQPSGTKIDLNKLANAASTEVTAYRNAKR